MSTSSATSAPVGQAESLTATEAWKALQNHYEEIGTRHLRDLVRGRPHAWRAFDPRGYRALFRLLKEPHHRRDHEAARRSRAAERVCGSASMPCSAATRSTSPKSARAARGVARPARVPSILVDGQNVVPEVHAVLDRMAAFSNRVRSGRMEGPHRQTHPQRGQYRHRRLRPRSGDGLRSAAALQRAGHDVPLRLQRRWHRFRRSRARSRPGRDALHHLFENLHHAGNHDQRALGARLVCWPASAATKTSVAKHFVAVSTNAEGSREVRHRHRQHVRLLGLGRRALFDGFGHRPFDHAGHRPGQFPRHARRLPRRWTSISAPRRSSAICPC